MSIIVSGFGFTVAEERGLCLCDANGAHGLASVSTLVFSLGAQNSAGGLVIFNVDFQLLG
jgi:hypothetical protein